MKILIVKGEVHLIEEDNKEELKLISDSNIWFYSDAPESNLKANGGSFDEIIAFADTQEMLNKK